MTKRTKTQRPRSGQRRAEKPVDSEIRRAAKRAGIQPKLALEDLKTALTQIADEKQARRVAEELKAATVAGAQPAPVEATPAPSERSVTRTMIGHAVVQASEMIAELLAGTEQPDCETSQVDLRDRLSEVNYHLWRVRWELGILPDDVAFHAERGIGREAES